MKAKIITPVVTIFDKNGKIDYEGNKKVIDYLINNGVDGLAPLGSTGEFPSMSFEEKKEFLRFYSKEVANRVPIIAGTGSMILEETVELSNYAFDLGITSVLIIPPYYFGMSQEEGFHYYDTLAKRIKANIYIYNFKARSGFDMSPETTLKLVQKHNNIIGMKDSTDDVNHTKEVLYSVLPSRPDFEMYSGFDSHFIPNVIAGGSGCIAAISNVFPELWAANVKAVNEGNFEEIKNIGKKIDILMKLYSIDSNFSLLFKKLMVERGLEVGTTTLFPFENISSDKYEKAIGIVKDLKLI